jgi:Na+-transporting NADH:ubiquinone oxidoreductase subunit C
MSSDSTKKIIVTALGVCLVCSILVASAFVSLHGRVERNKKLDMLKNILIAGNMYDKHTDVLKIFDEKIQTDIIVLKTGQIVPKSEYSDLLDPEDFNIKKLVKVPQYSEAIPANQDISGIKRKPRDMIVYKVVQDGKIEKIILPIYGKGLWSTMYAFIALDRDLKTIKGITFYEHGETPGLGGEVDNPRWKQLWVDKRAFDDEGNVKIEVIKGHVDETRPDAVYKIDGLTGATLTTRGVDHLVRYWLGENGYGPYLTKLKEEMIHGKI